jgi:hypothetical protein
MVQAQMKFQTHECPLCGEVLHFGKMSGVSSYFCRNAGTPGGNNRTHYEVELDHKESIQHLYAFPYAIDNFASKGSSRVYRWLDAKWKLITEVPRLEACSQDELLARLQIRFPL